jgi:hypothetical protein
VQKEYNVEVGFGEKCYWKMYNGPFWQGLYIGIRKRKRFCLEIHSGTTNVGEGKSIYCISNMVGEVSVL